MGSGCCALTVGGSPGGVHVAVPPNHVDGDQLHQLPVEGHLDVHRSHECVGLDGEGDSVSAVLVVHGTGDNRGGIASWKVHERRQEGGATGGEVVAKLVACLPEV